MTQNKNIHFLIGGQKCGTTWIARNLMQHPEISIPANKEIHFFNKKNNYAKGMDFYYQKFPSSEASIRLDCTPNYFWITSSEAEAIESNHFKNPGSLIKQEFPNSKFILTLRDPKNRAISAFFHHIRARRFSPKTSILDVLNQYGIESMGHYSWQLEEWFKLFDKKQFLILIYEDDIIKEPEETLKKICSFLGVDPTFKFSNSRQVFNGKGNSLYLHINYINPFLGKVFKRLPKIISQSDLFKIQVNEKEKEALKNIYLESNSKLEKLLNRKLPW